MADQATAGYAMALVYQRAMLDMSTGPLAQVGRVTSIDAGNNQQCGKPRSHHNNRTFAINHDPANMGEVILHPAVATTDLQHGSTANLGVTHMAARKGLLEALPFGVGGEWGVVGKPFGLSHPP